MYDWHFDDMAPGMRFESLGKTLSEAEIIDFAFQYDPQPFHIDKHTQRPGPTAGSSRAASRPSARRSA